MSKRQPGKSEPRPTKPVLHAPRPALHVGDFAQAIEHYVDWLGFNLDSEWREAPGQPAIGFLSRDQCVFMINEHPAVPGSASIHLDVSHLDVLAEEWNARRPGSVKIHRAPPYEFTAIEVLNEYTAYGELFDARRAAETKPTSEHTEEGRCSVASRCSSPAKDTPSACRCSSPSAG